MGDFGSERNVNSSESDFTVTQGQTTNITQVLINYPGLKDPWEFVIRDLTPSCEWAELESRQFNTFAQRILKTLDTWIKRDVEAKFSKLVDAITKQHRAAGHNLHQHRSAIQSQK